MNKPMGSGEPINPASLGAPKGYANGMLGAAGGRVLAIAGQIAWDENQRLVSSRFVDQFARTLRNVLAVVEAAGGRAEHVISLTLYVVDKKQYVAELRGVGAAYRECMGYHFPTMALVEVAGLLEDDALIEIQGLAVIPGLE